MTCCKMMRAILEGGARILTIVLVKRITVTKPRLIVDWQLLWLNQLYWNQRCHLVSKYTHQGCQSFPVLMKTWFFLHFFFIQWEKNVRVQVKKSYFYPNLCSLYCFFPELEVVSAYSRYCKCPKTPLVPDAAYCIQLIQRVGETDKTVTCHCPPTRSTPPPTPHPVSFLRAPRRLRHFDGRKSDWANFLAPHGNTSGESWCWHGTAFWWGLGGGGGGVIALYDLSGRRELAPSKQKEEIQRWVAAEANQTGRGCRNGGETRVDILSQRSRWLAVLFPTQHDAKWLLHSEILSSRV